MALLLSLLLLLYLLYVGLIALTVDDNFNMSSTVFIPTPCETFNQFHLVPAANASMAGSHSSMQDSLIIICDTGVYSLPITNDTFTSPAPPILLVQATSAYNLFDAVNDVNTNILITPISGLGVIAYSRGYACPQGFVYQAGCVPCPAYHVCTCHGILILIVTQ